MRLPDDFIWGTTSSSTQAEGAAPRSDWFRWEELGRAPRSGEGNAFATNYERDFSMLVEHALPHHRLTLEWARLEPQEGRHDGGGVEHYRAMLRSARDLGVSVWATLHHTSLPGWFADDLGGFTDDRARAYHWARHVDWMGETFGDLVHGWVPIDQPVAYATAAYLQGTRPPGATDVGRFHEGIRAVHLANLDAWRLLRSGGAPVATVMDVAPVHAAVRGREPDERDVAEEQARTLDHLVWGSWTKMLREGVLSLPGMADVELPDMAGAFDFVGASYEHATSVYADGSTGPYPADARVGPTGHAPWTEGLGVVVRRLADELPGRSLLVAACGFGTDDDRWRCDLIRDSIEEVVRAVEDRVPVKGFFHRTVVDGYEWERGFGIQYGLFDRDRKPKPSAELARDLATGIA